MVDDVPGRSVTACAPRGEAPRVELTPRERDLLHLIVRGRTPQQAAAELGLTAVAAREMLEGLQRRLGLSSPNHLIVRAILGLIR